MVWRSNLLGLGPSITESFSNDRCPRSFNEAIPTPKFQPKSPTSTSIQGQKQKQQLQQPQQHQQQKPQKQQKQPNQINQKPTEPTYRTGLRVEPIKRPDVRQPPPTSESLHTPNIPLNPPNPTRVSIKSSHHSTFNPPPPPLDREQLPPALVGMMDHIIGQVRNINLIN